MSKTSNKIAILNAGCILIERIDMILRTNGYDTDVLPLNTSCETLMEYQGIIISGGPSSVYNDDSPKCDPLLFETDIPILGICYGMQLIIQMCGGQITQMKNREDGKKILTISRENIKLFEGFSSIQPVFMSHGDSIKELAPGFVPTSYTENCIASIEHIYKNLYGVQFHPEAFETIYGKQILCNFANYICDMKQCMTLDYHYQRVKNSIINTTQNKKLIIFVSGGIASLMCLLTAYHTLKKNHKIIVVHINTGLLKISDTECIQLISKYVQIITINKADDMLNQLKLVSTPSQKKSVIDRIFKETIEDFIKSNNLDESDCVLIKSTTRSNIFKDNSVYNFDTHRCIILEPFVDMYKNQILEIAKKYKLLTFLSDNFDHNMYSYQGLASRIITNIDETNVTFINPTLCVVPVKIVNVKGEYKYIGVTTKYTPDESYNFLKTHNDVNGYFYLAYGDVCDLCVCKITISEKIIQLLNRINYEIVRNLKKLYINDIVVAWFPIGKGTIVIRTERKILFENVFNCIINTIKQFDDISHVLIDITDKPFIEYES